MSSTFVVNIKGTNWHISGLSKKDFLKKHPALHEGNPACADDECNEMDFVQEELYMGLIRHEVMHALVAENGGRAEPDMSPEDLEEVCANIAEKDLPILNEVSEQIADVLLREKLDSKKKKTKRGTSK